MRGSVAGMLLFVAVLELACSSCDAEQPPAVDLNAEEPARAPQDRRERERRAWPLAVEDPSRQVIRISNRGERVARFELTLNGLALSSLEEAAATIRQQAEEVPGEPDYRKAWRFVRDHRYHFAPVSKKIWNSHPTVLLNSAGFGFCGTSAEALAMLWRQLGYQTRIWWLSGHVVSELHADGRWQVYDADLETYYQTEDGRVAGAEELIAHPSLIRAWTHPVNPTRKYSNLVASIYQSREDNSVVDLETGERRVDEEIELELEVPPGGSLELPHRFAPEGPLTWRDERAPDYTNARLRVPRTWTRAVRISLLLQAVEGSANVTLDGAPYAVGSEELTARLRDHMRYSSRLQIVSADSDVDLVYLLNPRVYRLENENVLELEGVDLDGLDVAVTTLEAAR